jgi:hypothetical protein
MILFTDYNTIPYGTRWYIILVCMCVTDKMRCQEWPACLTTLFRLASRLVCDFAIADTKVCLERTYNHCGDQHCDIFESLGSHKAKG